MEYLVATVFLAALIGIAAFLWRQTKARGRWGFGGWKADCPRCGAPLPMVRKPTSMQETLWGGWTCPSCGCKVDKYGRERA